jgi:hypothetical protein
MGLVLIKYNLSDFYNKFCISSTGVQKSAGKVLASIFLGSRRHPPHNKGPNYQRGVLLISAGLVTSLFPS